MPFQQFLHQEMQREGGRRKAGVGGSTTLQEQNSILCCSALLCKEKRNLNSLVHASHGEFASGKNTSSRGSEQLVAWYHGSL